MEYCTQLWSHFNISIIATQYQSTMHWTSYPISKVRDTKVLVLWYQHTPRTIFYPILNHHQYNSISKYTILNHDIELDVKEIWYHCLPTPILKICTLWYWNTFQIYIVSSIGSGLGGSLTAMAGQVIPCSGRRRDTSVLTKQCWKSLYKLLSNCTKIFI